MKRLILPILMFGFLIVSTVAQGNDADPRVRRIADQLRCPVCRGVPIAASPSELATNMMQLIRQKVEEGRSDEEILRYFVDRYGEWILLEPVPEGINLSLWVLPALFLVGGSFFIGWSVFRWTKKTKEVL